MADTDHRLVLILDSRYSNTVVESANFRHVARIVQLEHISVYGGPCSTEAISQLAALPRLRSLDFTDGASFNFESFEAFARIKSLKSISMTAYSREQEARLKELRPDIELYFHYDYVP